MTPMSWHNWQSKKWNLGSLCLTHSQRSRCGDHLNYSSVIFWLDGFRTNQTCSKKRPLRSLRITLGDYEGVAPEDRANYLLDILEREVAAVLKPGVGRFEVLLESFGLSGAVPESVRRCLFELSQVRNVLVHRRGIADRRLIEQCPWLQLKIGDRAVVKNEQMHRYTTAAMAYSMIILRRLRCVF